MSYDRGIPTHESVLIFFRENPGKEFDTRQVADAIYLSMASVSTNARFLVGKGRLTRRPVSEGCGLKYLYRLRSDMPEDGRCKGLVNVETWPYSKRCENEVVEGGELCQPHVDAGYEL